MCELKERNFVRRFYCFLGFLSIRKAAKCYFIGRMVLDIVMARNWFKSMFVIFFNMAKMFAETVRKFPPCFSYFLHSVHVVQ